MYEGPDYYNKEFVIFISSLDQYEKIKIHIL